MAAEGAPLSIRYRGWLTRWRGSRSKRSSFQTIRVSPSRRGVRHASGPLKTTPASMDHLVLRCVEAPDGWTLTPADEPLIAAKSRANRLPFAVLLLFFRAHGRLPRTQDEITPDAVADVARQLGIGLAPTKSPAVSGRTVERHRAEIRTLLGFREMTVADAEVLTEWLRDHVVADSRPRQRGVRSAA